MPPFVYRNSAMRKNTGNHYLKVRLKGEGKNKAAVGAKVTLKKDGKLFYSETGAQPRFSVIGRPKLAFWSGKLTTVDSVIVDWYYGKRTVLTNVDTDQCLF